MTASELRQLITSKIEDQTIPNRVMDWARKNSRKRLRRNNLPEGADLIHIAGMTRLRFPTAWDIWTTYLLSYRTVNVMVPDEAELRRLNICWYEGLEERNKIRIQFLSNPDKVQDAADKITECQNLKAAYLQRLSELNTAYMGCRQALGPDGYDIRKLVEIEKKQ